MGAAVILLNTGQTLNMLSMFAFLMALGIVVDDAIVVGERTSRSPRHGERLRAGGHRRHDRSSPIGNYGGDDDHHRLHAFLLCQRSDGQPIAVMPVAIIAMLAISLIEAATALPCHLSHDPNEKPHTVIAKIMRSLSYGIRPVELLFNKGRRNLRRSDGPFWRSCLYAHAPFSIAISTARLSRWFVTTVHYRRRGESGLHSH